MIAEHGAARRRRAAVLTSVLSAVLVVATSCSADVQGTPTSAGSGAAPPPDTSGAAPPPDTSGSGTATEIPSPPSEVSSAGIDPCTLVPDAQWADVQIKEAAPSDDGAFDGATCLFTVSGEGGYAITATDGVTVEEFTAAAEGRENDVSGTAGFPTVTSYDPADTASCAVAVGTSATGMIAVVTQDPTATEQDKDSLCGRTRDVAAVALTALQSQQ